MAELAADLLPANTLDRIVLLSPSVCTAYDLRPALRSSRKGSTCSIAEKIAGSSAWASYIVGTTEGAAAPPSGKFGFTPVIDDLL